MKIRNYFTSLKKYVPIIKYRKIVIFGSLGTVGLYYLNYRKNEDFIVDEYPRRLPATIYRLLPFRKLSELTGHLANIEIPYKLREPILGTYVKYFGCNLDEAIITNVIGYNSLLSLFTRRLKWESRPINQEDELVSPCDGRIMSFGEIDRINGTLEQIKGVKFSLAGFLGQDLATKMIRETRLRGNKLNYTVIYLAPGDYHRFHSPAKFNCSLRRYYPGALLSVNPMLAGVLPGLFSVNERAVYYGTWKYGQMAIAPVAATNVGNIYIPLDRQLPQNSYQDNSKYSSEYQTKLSPTHIRPLMYEKRFTKSNTLKYHMGQLFGIFNLGSTVVLIFESPTNFKMNLITSPSDPHPRILMGTPLGHTIEATESQRSVTHFNI